MSNTNIIAVLQTENKKKQNRIEELERELEGIKHQLDLTRSELILEKLKYAS